MNEEITPLYCANHPTVETHLRCNNCGKPICPKCAVATPTGYRCKECVRSQQKLFETAQWFDYLTAGITALVLSFIGALIIPRLGFFVLILAPIVGVIIAESCRLIINKRRSKRLYLTIAITTALGSLLLVLMNLLSFIVALNQFNFSGFIYLILQLTYTIMVTSTTYYRLSGLHLKL
ncbi:MAG: B-box zinc finger protein [Anaerolineales bacterium]